MPIDLPTSGFLTEDARSFRQVVHRELPGSVSLFYRTNALAVDQQHSVQVSRTSLSQALASILFARTVASAQASALLLEHGMPTQARMTLRGALETLFQLAAIATNPDTAQDLLASHEADRRTIADRIRQWQDPALRAAVSSAIAESELDAMLESRAKGVNIFNLAKSAGLEDWYHSIYTLLSFATHGKVSDLQAHVVTDEFGGPVEFKSEPTLDDQDATWGWAIETELCSMHHLASIFGSNTQDVEALRAELQALPAGA